MWTAAIFSAGEKRKNCSGMSAARYEMCRPRPIKITQRNFKQKSEWNSCGEGDQSPRYLCAGRFVLQCLARTVQTSQQCWLSGCTMRTHYPQNCSNSSPNYENSSPRSCKSSSPRPLFRNCTNCTVPRALYYQILFFTNKSRRLLTLTMPICAFGTRRHGTVKK